MYELNGIVYADEKTELLEVTKIKTLPGRMMLVTFSNNVTKLFDTTLLKGSAFEPLNDEAIFHSAKITNGFVSWNDGEIDCSPDFMYDNGYKYDTDKQIQDIYQTAV